MGAYKLMEGTKEEAASLMEAVKRQSQTLEVETKKEEEEEEEEHDMGGSGKNLRRRSWNESKKIWEIALPVILGSGSEFSIIIVTAFFVGHLGELEFAAVSIVQNVVEGLIYGIMVSHSCLLLIHDFFSCDMKCVYHQCVI